MGDEEMQLAPKEFDLLWELLDHRGLVLTRDQLLERVWGYTFAGDTRTVDVHVRQLRRKLGDASPIVTVWGVGYKVSPERASPAARSARPRLRRMFRSLRFRLPALFFAGRSSSRHRRRRDRVAAASSRTRSASARAELRREAPGLTRALRRRGAARGRRGLGRDRLRGLEARARDRRPDLLRRRLALPG